MTWTGSAETPTGSAAGPRGSPATAPSTTYACAAAARPIGGDETELTGRAAESDTAGEAMEALATGRTLSLIAQLPQDQAEAVVLRVVVGLDAKTAAETLGKRPGAVRTAAHRGLKTARRAARRETRRRLRAGPGAARRRPVGHDAVAARDREAPTDLTAYPAARSRPVPSPPV